MRTLSPALETAFGENLTFICRLWTITRKDGVIFRFTDHDQDIPFEGNDYLSSTSFEATAVRATLNSAANDLDVRVLLAEGSIEYEAMQRGMFDDAPVTLQLVSFTGLTAGAMDLFTGNVGKISLPNRQVATLALVGGVRKTNRVFTENYSATCRASFGDARCKVDLNLYSVNFTIDASLTAQSFTASELVASSANLFVLGTVEWLTGDNTGTRVEVAGNSAGTVSLLFKPPYQMQAGDTGKIIRGCTKTVAACTAYGNLANYRGEPYVPGDDGLGL